MGGKHATAAGAARSKDHNRLIDSLWMLALKLDIALWMDRVPTKENIADLPSREFYELLERLEATCVKPLLESAFNHPERALAQLAGIGVAKNMIYIYIYICKVHKLSTIAFPIYVYTYIRRTLATLYISWETHT